MAKKKCPKKMKKVMVVFGTRPEAIKMAPVIKEFQNNYHSIKTLVCVTGQHKEMLNSVLQIFKIKPQYNLNIMKPNQSLFDITELVLKKISKVLLVEKPDIVLVHGDTSTTFATSLACFYLNIPVAHVEAGLRTYNLNSPYPEEFNRQVVSVIAKINFCPTELAKKNLIHEGKNINNIYVTGNTAIDALKYTNKPNYSHKELNWAKGSRLILITAHRRENLGEPMKSMFRAIKKVLSEHKDVKAIYPIHLNPKVRAIANKELKGVKRIHIIEPLDVMDFHNFMSRSYLILTDSGGIQEEAPSFGVPVLVMRNTTERPEGIKAGTLRLVGADFNNIYNSFTELLNNKYIYNRMAKAKNPYGDGKASSRIASITNNFLTKKQA